MHLSPLSRYILTTLLIFSGAVSSVLANSLTDDVMRYTALKLEQANVEQTIWTGPTDGPTLINSKTVLLIASDLRDGGVNAVTQGLIEALRHTDWQLTIFDGSGSSIKQKSAVQKAIMAKPDAIVFAGVDLTPYPRILNVARNEGITLVGWHASNENIYSSSTVTTQLLFTNIASDSASTGELAALFAIRQTLGNAKVVIVTDSSLSNAQLKVEGIQDAFSMCPACKILSIADISLDNTTSIAHELSRVLEDYGQLATHIVATSDLYFDYATPIIEDYRQRYNVAPITITAGEGSSSSAVRIRDHQFQVASVAEPLNLQGWQLVDELNRAFNNQEPSGFSAPVRLLTHENINSVENPTLTYDPNNDYRVEYLKIWEPK